MKEIRLALLGFGSANRALAQMLLDKSEEDDSGRQCLQVPASESLTSKLIPWKVVCIITRRHGSIYASYSTASEINLQGALERIGAGGILDASLVRNTNEVTQSASCTAITTTDATIKLLNELGHSQAANIVVEAIPSNHKSNGEPAISFIRTALQAGMHVASANKCPLAHSRNNIETYFELQEAAKKNGKLYLHESAVMDGVPIFSLWNNALPSVKCRKIRGLLNSTTTMILSRMEGNIAEVVESNGLVEHVSETFEDALEASKQMGIVEEDESLDIDGIDAAMKLRALCVFLSSPAHLSSSSEHITRIPALEDISRDSIGQIDSEILCTEYRTSRKRLRSVASAELIELPSDPTQGRHHPIQSWKMNVTNEFLSPSDPLHGLNGTSSSVQFCTDVMGPISIVSSDPTLTDTAYGLFADIVRIASQAHA